jgi:hypothetical protein
MQVIDLIVVPLILFLLLAVSYGYVLGGGELGITKRLIRWAAILIGFCILARMFVPHG